MRLTMKERKTLTKALAEQYRRGSKGLKGEIVDQFAEATGYNRCYATRLLRNHGKRVYVRPDQAVEGDAHLRPQRTHRRTYDENVVAALTKIWELLDYMTGKRLAPALREVVPRLVACRELRLKKSLQKQLMNISPATIDRLLKPQRAKHTLKGRATTKPGTLLKHQIPIRTFSDWDDARAGFLEMDLVGHDGGRAEGDYCFTLDLTDVDTGWTALAAVPNKAQIWVFEALQGLQRRLPFPVLGLDSDNGGEFINHHLAAYCIDQKITFTRSRPWRKNDACYVEQKNWSVVRRFVGYARYDSPEALQILNDLYLILSDYNNFFLPSQKLKEKTRDGAHVRRRYHPAQTPYQRVMESPHVNPALKKTLEAHYQTLNPAALHRQIQKCQQKLLKLTARLQQPQEIPHDEFTAFVPIRRTKKNRGGRTAPILRLGP